MKHLVDLGVNSDLSSYKDMVYGVTQCSQISQAGTLEPSSRFSSSSQNILALFTYLLRFFLSRLELSYIAESVIGRHPVSYVACLSVTLTKRFRGLPQSPQASFGTRKTIYILYLSVINKYVSHYLVLE